MSWHYLREQEAESSEDICSDGKPWRPVKSKITHERHYYGDRLTESYLDSLSGMISEHSMGLSFGDVSISFQEDSPVKTSHQQVKALESLANALGSGKKCSELLTRYDHGSHSWKTLQCSLLGDLEPFSETWPKSGTMQNGVCWERMMSELHTKGKESGFWPTPTKRDWKSESCKPETAKTRNHHSRGKTLPWVILHGGVPTRQTWPTSNDRKPANKTEVMEFRQENRRTTVQRLRAAATEPKQIGMALNPNWVEWLMNWPCGWTSLEELNSGHFEYWKKASAEGFQEPWEMRDMREHGETTPSPQRSQHDEQQSREHPNTMREMPRKDSCRRTVGGSRESENLPQLRETVSIQESKRELLQPTLCESLGMGEEETVQRVATGVNNRVDRLKAIGNGQVPAVAAVAFLILYKRIIESQEEK